MRILLYLDQVRTRMGGGALSMWRTLEGLASRGCEVRVAAKYVAGERTVRGMAVSREGNRDHFEWADVVLTGVGRIARHAVDLAQRTGTYVACFVHSVTRDPQLPKHARIGRRGCQLVVWGSEAMRSFAHSRGWQNGGPELVLWPPIFRGAYEVPPGDRVTLVNLQPDKGSDLFAELVTRMPDVRFLGVTGGWGNEAMLPEAPNLELIPYQEDPREVLRRTRVLLYPKGRQSGPGWLHGIGMAAMEAACAGIPTIAYPGPGLRESLADGAVWVDSLEASAWEQKIRELANPLIYQAAADRARLRSQALHPEADLDRLYGTLRELVVGSKGRVHA